MDRAGSHGRDLAITEQGGKIDQKLDAAAVFSNELNAKGKKRKFALTAAMRKLLLKVIARDARPWSCPD